MVTSLPSIRNRIFIDFFLHSSFAKTSEKTKNRSNVPHLFSFPRSNGTSLAHKTQSSDGFPILKVRSSFKVGSSKLEVQSWKFKVGSSKFKVGSSKLEVQSCLSHCVDSVAPSAVFPTFVSSCLRVRSSSAYLLKSQQSNIKYHQSSISSLLALPTIDSGAPPAPLALRATSLCSCPNGLQAFSRFHSSPFTLHFH
jgi:hypothetical protein